MNISIELLRAETGAAIQAGIDAFQRKEEEKVTLALAKKKEAEAWVEKILLQVPSLAKDAATKGKYRVKIADTSKDYYAVKRSNSQFLGWDKENETGLKFYSLQLHLEKLGFLVSIEYNHDGVGVSDWFEIWISWN